MKGQIQEIVKKRTGAEEILRVEEVQSLWSGYGHIWRLHLQGGDRDNIIVKHVSPPDNQNHPRGWNSDHSHQRKIQSYQVESYWYQHWASLCDDHCRIPESLGIESSDSEFLMLLEDLDSSGYPIRKSSVNMKEIEECLRWLASFHATFMLKAPEGLWPTGTYWHLQTRPDELQALSDSTLKQSAHQIDSILNESPYQTLVHGDAKLANFCFSASGKNVAAVDFQYVGGGCGMKDVAYFIGSCLYEEDCKRYEASLLNRYFNYLQQALHRDQSDIDPIAVEEAWRPLYRVAWTDFHRFVKGWSPGHWKIHGYSEQVAKEVISRLTEFTL